MLDNLIINIEKAKKIIEEVGRELLSNFPLPDYYCHKDKVSIMWHKDWKTDLFLIIADNDSKVLYRHDFIDEELPADSFHLIKCLQAVFDLQT